jgi:arylsulfatase A-like enzyme
VQGRSFLPLLRGQGYEARQEIFAEKTWHDVYDPMRAVRTERFKYVRNFPGQDGSPAAHRPQLCLPTDIERSLSRRSLAGLGDPHLRPRGEEELYDLSKDPDELRNVAEEPAYGRLLSELRRRLEEWMATTGDPLLAGPVSCPDPVLQNR